MKNHVCRRCGYSTTKKSHLSSHLARATPCEPILEDVDCKVLLVEVHAPSGMWVCSNCHRQYAHQSGLSRHKSKCKQLALQSDVDDMKEKFEEFKQLVKDFVDKLSGH